MPRNARCVEPGLAYHVTQRGSNRQKVFFGPTDHKMYLSLMQQQLGDAGCRVLGYCLMTNHVHLVVVPERADSLAVLFCRVHGRYSQYLNTRRRRSGHLWQQRYYSCPLSASHLWVALRYVEQNPCRAGMAQMAEHYRWSSTAAHLGGSEDRSSELDMDFWREAGGAQALRELLGPSETAEQIQKLRRCIYSGCPFGEEIFVTELEERFQRSWRRFGFEKAAASA